MNNKVIECISTYVDNLDQGKNQEYPVLTSSTNNKELVELVLNIIKYSTPDFNIDNTICAICYDTVSIPNICSLDCKCKIYYHNVCILKAFNYENHRNKCLQCRQTVSHIYDFPSLLNKFTKITSKTWTNLYKKIMSKYTTLTETYKAYNKQIILCDLFFNQIRCFRKNFPNYILLPVFKYYEYMTYSNKEHFQRIHNVFLNSIENDKFKLRKKQKMQKKHKSYKDEIDKYVLQIPSLYQNGDYTINSEDIFHKKFEEFTYNLIDDSFNWDNIAILGGSLYRLLSPIFSDFKIIPNSADIDIFIYGPNQDDRKNALKRTLEYFKNRYGDNVYFVYGSSIINIYVKGVCRHVQIICNNVTSIIEQLEIFDCEHLQLAYFNQKLYATPMALKAIKTQVTYRSRANAAINADRIKKFFGFHLTLGISLYLNNADTYETILCKQSKCNFYEALANVRYKYNDNKINIKINIITRNNHNININNEEINNQNIDQNMDQNIDKSIYNSHILLDLTTNHKYEYHPKFNETDYEIRNNLLKFVIEKNAIYIAIIDTIPITQDPLNVFNKTTFSEIDNGFNEYY